LSESPECRGDDWRSISSAPFDRDLALSVIEGNDVHALLFPWRRTVASMSQCIGQVDCFCTTYARAPLAEGAGLIRIKMEAD
jgi:hypothetical protein